MIVEFITMAKVLVLFIYLLMVLFCDASCRLKYLCTNDQSRICIVIRIGAFTCYRCYTYWGFRWFVISSATNIKNYQYLDDSLIIYLKACLDVIFSLGGFQIVYISRHENWRELTYQASGYHVDHSVLHIYQ